MSSTKGCHRRLDAVAFKASKSQRKLVNRYVSNLSFVISLMKDSDGIGTWSVVNREKRWISCRRRKRAYRVILLTQTIGS